MVVLYLKSFEFHEVRSSFEEKGKKREIVERQIGQVQTRSNLFEILREESAKKLWSTMTWHG